MRYKPAEPWAQKQSRTVPKGLDLETATPTRAADLTADLLVPLGQAGVTGALLGGLITFLAWELAPELDGDPLKVWSVLSLAISTVTWLLLLDQTRRLLWAVERWTGRDLDGDRVAGPPSERLVVANAAAGQREAEQRANAQRASQFAKFVAALPARGTAMADWTDLGRDTYQEYRDALIRLGWAAWNSTKKDGTPNKKQGWALTLPAEEILRRIG